MAKHKFKKFDRSKTPPKFRITETDLKILLSKSKRYRRLAGKILQESKIISILKDFGKVELTGSYAADLMMNGDIDIYVINSSFSKNRVLDVFNKIVKSCKFQGYLFYDWKSHKHSEFPSGYYIGLKTKKYNDKWKIDIWFITRKEVRRIRYFNLKEMDIDKEKTLVILRLKDYRNKLPQNIPSNIIYDAVLENNIFTVPDFKKYLIVRKKK